MSFKKKLILNNSNAGKVEILYADESKILTLFLSAFREAKTGLPIKDIMQFRKTREVYPQRQRYKN